MVSTNLRQLWIAAGLALCTAGAAQLSAAGISGVIKFDGAPPKMKKIKMAQEKSCEAHHKEPIRQESCVVNANSTLKDAFVYLKAAPAGAAIPEAAGEVTIDQKGCQYVPHVLGIRVGQTLKILNSDTGVLHNIHSFGGAGNAFNMGQPGNGAVLTQKFAKPETMVKLKCDVHGWMESYVGVLEHPFFAVSNDKGEFTIDGVPAGEYDLECWTEACGTQTQKVKVEAAGASGVTFTFKAPAK